VHVKNSWRSTPKGRNGKFFICGPKFTGHFLWNAGGIAVDHISFPSWISGVVPEYICDQNRKLLKIAPNFGRVFHPSKILGGGPSKSYTHVTTIDPCLSAARRIENVFRILPLAPKLYGLTRWKLNQILSFHNGGPSSQFECALATSEAWSICNACKNFRAQGRNAVFSLPKSAL